jgi:hypothetical protein
MSVPKPVKKACKAVVVWLCDIFGVDLPDEESINAKPNENDFQYFKSKKPTNDYELRNISEDFEKLNKILVIKVSLKSPSTLDRFFFFIY